MSIIQGNKVIASKATNGFSLFDYKYADHLLNNVSWLRSDTFSWQSGNVYKYAYQHLLNEANEIAYYIPTITEADTGTVYYTWKASNGKYYATLKETPASGDTIYGYDKTGNVTMTVSETLSSVSSEKLTLSNGSILYRDREALQIDIIDGIEIPCFIASDKHKICLPSQESNIIKLFNTTGAADYYIVDKPNNQFKLPRKYKRKLVRTLNNADGSWYRLYSDGWVEQGGYRSSINQSTETQIDLPITMSNMTYYININSTSESDGAAVSRTTRIISTSRIGVRIGYTSELTRSCSWEVKGYAHDSEYLDVGMNFEYYYVGNFESSSIEQTAGLNAELLSGKLDADLAGEMLNKKINVDLTNIPFGYDMVIEYQTPTAANSYKWYRKYKSGWVEQGVSNVDMTSAVYTFTFPVVMKDTTYTVTTGIQDVLNTTAMGLKYYNITTTSLQVRNTYQTSGSTLRGSVVVQGMAA